jgi:penicillin-binding protein-related factor A (putative recombinase)
MSRSQANRGKGWEQQLELMHYRYQKAGDANIVKRDPPHTRVRSRARLPPGQYVARGGEKGEPDYSGGVILPEIFPFAFAVKFDAKQVSDGKGRFAFSGLSLAQADALDAAVAAHTFAFIALDLDGQHLVVPWGMADHTAALGLLWRRWHDRKARGQKALPGTASLTLEQALAAGARRMHFRNGWLPVVRDMLREQLS